jgi:hypothetical protein
MSACSKGAVVGGGPTTKSRASLRGERTDMGGIGCRPVMGAVYVCTNKESVCILGGGVHARGMGKPLMDNRASWSIQRMSPVDAPGP